MALLTTLLAMQIMSEDHTGVALVALGIVMIIAELFAPTLGVLGAAGTLVLGFGALLILDPGLRETALSLPVILTAALVLLVLLAVILAAAMRAQRTRVTTGENAMIGQTGEILSWSAGRGRIKLGDESWDACSNIPFAAGERVTITARDGLTLHVKPADAKNQENAP